jgi:hypothetical protein
MGGNGLGPEVKNRGTFNCDAPRLSQGKQCGDGRYGWRDNAILVQFECRHGCVRLQ